MSSFGYTALEHEPIDYFGDLSRANSTDVSQKFTDFSGMKRHCVLELSPHRFSDVFCVHISPEDHSKNVDWFQSQHAPMPSPLLMSIPYGAPSSPHRHAADHDALANTPKRDVFAPNAIGLPPMMQTFLSPPAAQQKPVERQLNSNRNVTPISKDFVSPPTKGKKQAPAHIRGESKAKRAKHNGTPVSTNTTPYQMPTSTVATPAVPTNTASVNVTPAAPQTNVPAIVNALSALLTQNGGAVPASMDTSALAAAAAAALTAPTEADKTSRRKSKAAKAALAEKMLQVLLQTLVQAQQDGSDSESTDTDSDGEREQTDSSASAQPRSALSPPRGVLADASMEVTPSVPVPEPAPLEHLQPAQDATPQAEVPSSAAFPTEPASFTFDALAPLKQLLAASTAQSANVLRKADEARPRRQRLDPETRRARRLARKAELARETVLRRNRRCAELQALKEKLTQRLAGFEDLSTGLPRANTTLHVVTDTSDAVSDAEAALNVAQSGGVEASPIDLQRLLQQFPALGSAPSLMEYLRGNGIRLVRVSMPPAATLKQTQQRALTQQQMYAQSDFDLHHTSIMHTQLPNDQMLLLQSPLRPLSPQHALLDVAKSPAQSRRLPASASNLQSMQTERQAEHETTDDDASDNDRSSDATAKLIAEVKSAFKQRSAEVQAAAELLHKSQQSLLTGPLSSSFVPNLFGATGAASFSLQPVDFGSDSIHVAADPTADAQFAMFHNTNSNM
jgi:hypothetical protein